MSVVRQGEPQTSSLFGTDGELVLLRVTVEPRLLEELLEALAHLDFPVNPELHHLVAQVAVEFPAYASRVDEVRRILQAGRFDPNALETRFAFATGA
jgi:hypothetical protein